MREFIWAAVLLWGMETILKVIALAKGRLAVPTPASYSLDVIITGGFLVWGAVLLAR